MTRRAIRVCRRLASAFFVGVLFSPSSFAEVVSNDPFRACYRAAAHVEAEWHLPRGLLSAIGTVESGRGGLGGTLPVAWPWSINVEGHGAYLHDKASAVAWSCFFFRSVRTIGTSRWASPSAR